MENVLWKCPDSKQKADSQEKQRNSAAWEVYAATGQRARICDRALCFN